MPIVFLIIIPLLQLGLLSFYYNSGHPWAKIKVLEQRNGKARIDEETVDDFDIEGVNLFEMEHS